MLRIKYYGKEMKTTGTVCLFDIIVLFGGGGEGQMFDLFSALGLVMFHLRRPYLISLFHLILKP